MSNSLSPVTAELASQRRSRVLDAINGPSHSKREHDLRNLLYLISSFTQLLSDGMAGSVTARQQELLGHVLDCTRNMRQLLDTSRDAVVCHVASCTQPAAAANS